MLSILSRINSHQGLAPEYGPRSLTNHLPMAVFALYQLEGNEVDLDRFTKFYMNDNDLDPTPAPTGLALDDENWADHWGTRKYFSDYRFFFEEKLVEKGREQLLKDYLNPLLPGISAAAFHSFIRVAYGVRAENDQEILSGLAYLADTYLPLQGPMPEISDKNTDMREDLNHISEQLSKGDISLPEFTGVIFQKMDTIARADIFAHTVSTVQMPSGVTLKGISEVTLDIYLCTKNFTALHMLTGCHASRILMPYIKDEKHFLKCLFQAILAAHLTIKAPHIKEHPPTIPSLDKNFIEALKAVAQKSNNDHDIKLSFSILEESKAYNNPAYLSVALLLFPELASKIPS